MKRRVLFNMLTLLIVKSFALADTQPIILLGEINDQSPGAESYSPQVPSKLKQAIKEQSNISATYDQKQEEIAEEEDSFDDMGMGYGMFGEPFGGYGFGDMYPTPSVIIPINNNQNTSTNANQQPKVNKSYESQLPNGDILFKQW